MDTQKAQKKLAAQVKQKKNNAALMFYWKIECNLMSMEIY